MIGTSQNSDKPQAGIIAVVTLKAEILVSVPNGTKAEMAAREYLMMHPDALRLTTLSCEATKIKRLRKAQGGEYNPDEVR